MFCMFPDSKSEWKKWATGQSFIWNEITSYRIGTLVWVYQKYEKKSYTIKLKITYKKEFPLVIYWCLTVRVQRTC